MTATDILRRLLDKRGVEWMPSVFDPQHETFYSVENGVGFIVTEFPEIGRMSLACDMRITPEQAVEATLGRGTCHDLGGIGANGEQVFNCSECHCVLSLYDRDGSNNLCTSFIFDYPRYCPECGKRVVYDQ